MKIFSIVFLLMVALVGFQFYRSSDVGDPDKCENVFVSGIYTEYCRQLALPEFEDPKEQRAFHESFVAAIRQEPSESHQDLFIKPDLKEAYQRFLEAYIPPYVSGDFGAYLQEGLRMLQENPKWNGLKHNTPYDDSFFEGNLPFLQFTLPNGTQVVRMAMPVVDGPSYFTSRPVHSEFLRFVRSCKQHLYVNLMKRHGLEAPLSAALESLEEKEANLAVATLDKNSDFYWQEGAFPNSAREFKRMFLKELFGENFYWPSRLNHSEWEKELAALIEEVHAEYFQNRPSLTSQDREDFIELTYLGILDHLTAHFHPSSLNITCKQSMDRGPSLAVLWQWKQGLADEREVAALLLAPPLLVHNRPPHRTRIGRFISAYKKIMDPLRSR